MTHSILTVRELLSALALAPLDACVNVLDASGSLCPVWAELNTVPGLVDATGMSTLEVSPSARVILLPLDHIGPGWPGGVTILLHHGGRHD